MRLCLSARDVPTTDMIRFDITPNGQQIHVAFGENENLKSRRHPCFKIDNLDGLLGLRAKIWKHFEVGGLGAPLEADKPGEEDSGMSFLAISV